MLKYFYKTFLISILCGSLLMLDMSYKAGVVNVGFNSARAESVSTGGVDDSNLMSTLTMVGISVIASRLILYGTLTTDIGLAAAGGLAFIAGDMMATSKLKEAKKKIETEIKRGKNGDITDEQRQSLMRLLNMYKASLGAAETKKNLQLAAAAAFAAAAIAAYMASTLEVGLDVACQTATAAVTSAAQAALSNPYTATLAGTCLTAQGLSKTAEGKYTGGREVPAPSCPSITTVLPSWAGGVAADKSAGVSCSTFGGAAQSSACQAMFTGKKANEPIMCAPPGLLLATTAATVVLMGITASTLITAVVGFSAPLAEMVDIAIYTPKRRAIVWGVLAGLAFASSSSTSNVISQIEGDIKKIESLLNTINAQASGTIASNGIQKPTSNGTNVKPNQFILREAESNNSDVKIEGGKIPCITNPDNKGGTCPTVSSTLQNSTGFNNLPEGFKTDVMNIGQATDGLNGASTVSASSLNAASSIGANAARLLNGLKKTKEDFQNRLIASKSKTNLNDEEKKFKDSINNAFKAAMIKNKTNSKALLASYGSGSSLGELSKATEDTAKLLGDKMPKGLGEFKIPNIPTPEIPAMPNYAQGSDTPTADELAKMENNDEASKSGVTMDDYEIKTDITRDSKENIFDVISKRYKKSGYPRLFKRLAE